MKKISKIVLFIVVAALFLGAVSVGVGVMTGADADRIYSVLDDRYHVTVYYNYARQLAGILLDQLTA